MEFRKCNTVEVKNVIWRHYSARPAFSNYYLNDIEQLEYFEDRDTLLLRKKEHDFSRLYFYAHDLNRLANVLDMMPPKSVINIPVRNENSGWDSELAKCGFTLISRYERWFNPETPIVDDLPGHMRRKGIAPGSNVFLKTISTR